MNILFVVIGKNPRHHAQTYFGICSFLNQTDLNDAVFVVTDAPDFYKRFGEKVTVIPLSEARLLEWQGPYKFFWRPKLMGIYHVCALHPDKPLFYVDTDTFLFANLKQLKSDFQTTMMHLNEGKLSQRKSKTERLMWKQVKNKTFAGITIHENHCMWNAGVIAIPANKCEPISRLAVDIADGMLASKVTPYFIEQLALSIALTENEDVQAADKYIGHYWSNKDEWTDKIYKFIITSTLKNNSVEDDIEAISQFNFSEKPVLKRVPNTQIRLKKLVEKWFPSKDKIFITAKNT